MTLLSPGLAPSLSTSRAVLALVAVACILAVVRRSFRGAAKTMGGVPQMPHLQHDRGSWDCCFANTTTDLQPPACCDTHMTDPDWVACHKQHVAAVAQQEAAAQGWRLLLLGDSITELWLGANRCKPHGKGGNKAFQEHFARFRPGVMAIAADCTQHLLWRLQHGEAPTKHAPEVVVVEIGTNDLGYAALNASAGGRQAMEAAVSQHVLSAAHGVLRVLLLLRARYPAAHVVLLALLPRGCGSGMGCTRGPDAFAWPSVFTGGLAAVNSLLAGFASLDPQLHFVDCGAPFVLASGAALDGALMPDAVHPSPAGYERLAAECLAPAVAALMRPDA